MPTHPLNVDLRSVGLFPGSGEKPKLPAPLPSLTNAFSRRRALFGAVALAAAPVAMLPALASTVGRSNNDVLVAALMAEFKQLAYRGVHRVG